MTACWWRMRTGPVTTEFSQPADAALNLSHALHTTHGVSVRTLHTTHSVSVRTLHTTHSVSVRTLHTTHSVSVRTLHTTHSVSVRTLHTTHSVSVRTLHTTHGVSVRTLHTTNGVSALCVRRMVCLSALCVRRMVCLSARLSSCTAVPSWAAFSSAPNVSFSFSAWRCSFCQFWYSLIYLFHFGKRQNSVIKMKLYQKGGVKPIVQ